jgi:hypothetical protein
MYTPEGIAQFCAAHARMMKKSVLKQLVGITEAVEVDEEYIENYFPKNTHRQKRALVKGAFEAWDSLLSVCVHCPTRCLSEKDRPSELFEQYKDW